MLLQQVLEHFLKGWSVLFVLHLETQYGFFTCFK